MDRPTFREWLDAREEGNRVDSQRMYAVMATVTVAFITQLTGKEAPSALCHVFMASAALCIPICVTLYWICSNPYLYRKQLEKKFESRLRAPAFATFFAGLSTILYEISPFSVYVIGATTWVMGILVLPLLKESKQHADEIIAKHTQQGAAPTQVVEPPSRTEPSSTAA